MITFRILTVVALTNGLIEITNYTDAQTVTIYNGIGQIQIGTTRIVHIIDLDHVQLTMGKLTDYIDQDFNDDKSYHLLNYELTQTKNLLDTVILAKTRKTRSINLIGTAWKYVAGSPDHDDLVALTDGINDLTDNNNRQVIINRQLENRMNLLTDVTTKIQNSIRKDSTLKDELAIRLQNQIRLVKEEIVNIKFAIQWARLGVMNTFLLNEFELKEIDSLLKINNMPTSALTVEEMLKLSDVSVLHNGTTILYVIKIPILKPTNFLNYQIRPVKKNNNIINLPAKEIFKFKDEMYGINAFCKSSNSLKICKDKFISNLSKDLCLPELLNGKQSRCEFANAEHIPAIEEIDDGLILLNDFNGTVNWRDIERRLSGTYLITFLNETLKINGREFSNNEVASTKPAPPLIQLTPYEVGRLRILSLEVLEQLHLNNTSELRKLRTHSTINRVFGATILMMIAVLIFVTNRCCRRGKKVVLQIDAPGIQNIDAVPKPPQITPPTMRFNNIPFF